MRGSNPIGPFELPLPWGVSLGTTALDDLARTVDTLGVYDLVVTEAIWRLVRPGDVALDVGGNVGYMAMAMAARMKTSGRIFSFEPHPDLFEELTANGRRLKGRFPNVEFVAKREALSSSGGTVWLSQPAGASSANRGLAHVGAAGLGIEVPARRLDDYARTFGSDVALMKIDVEGHEAEVFRGGMHLLKTGVIRNVILEEHGRHPTESSVLLEECGYEVFPLERTLVRARLGDPARPRRTSWEAPSLLATREPEKVRMAFRSAGWRALAG